MASIHHFDDRDRWEVFWREPGTGRQRGRVFETAAAARRFALEVDVAGAARRVELAAAAVADAEARIRALGEGAA